MPKPYPKEFREDVVRVARNREPGVTLEQIGADFGVHPITLSKWLRRADTEEGARPAMASDASAELREARKRIRLLEYENEALRRAAIGTLVERTTRFTMLVHLPREEGYGVVPHTKNGPALAGYGAITMKNALARTMITLPEQLRRSLTWDRGKELSAHAAFTVETGIPVYFAAPHSLRQRGTNENTNGLLRQYTVCHGPYSGGRSLHGAPVRTHQRIPLTSLRRPTDGRPNTATGSIGSSTAH